MTPSASAAAAAAQPLDLLVRGGRVLGRGEGLDDRLDVGVRYGRIVAIGRDLSALVAPPQTASPYDQGTTIIDAADAIVAPGFIDIHTHVFTGVCRLTVCADESAPPGGVTTAVSAGDAGANTIEAFRKLIVDTSRTRVLAYLHVSSVGLAPWPAAESRDPALLDVDAGIRAARENADIVAGIKVRMSSSAHGDNDLEPLVRALAVAEAVGLPLMVHIGRGPRPIGDVVGRLRPGDIVTHCFTGSPATIIEDGHVAPDVREARSRGVMFDVGHGLGSFDYRVFDAAIADGFWPDLISTDVHSLSSRVLGVDMPTTLAKLIGAGMPIEDAIAAVTTRAAAALRRSDTIGAIADGRVADITVFRVDQREQSLRDGFGGERTVPLTVSVLHTIRAGIPWRSPVSHPGRASLPASDAGR